MYGFAYRGFHNHTPALNCPSIPSCPAHMRRSTHPRCMYPYSTSSSASPYIRSDSFGSTLRRTEPRTHCTRSCPTPGSLGSRCTYRCKSAAPFPLNCFATPHSSSSPFGRPTGSSSFLPSSPRRTLIRSSASRIRSRSHASRPFRRTCYNIHPYNFPTGNSRRNSGSGSRIHSSLYSFPRGYTASPLHTTKPNTSLPHAGNPLPLLTLHTKDNLYSNSRNTPRCNRTARLCTIPIPTYTSCPCLPLPVRPALTRTCNTYSPASDCRTPTAPTL